MIALIGKLPAHGDFIRRGDAAMVLEAVDRWLEDGFAAAPALAERIDSLDGWGFAVRIAGQPATGAIVASRDRVGRRFPLIGLRVGGGATVPPAWPIAAAALLAQARDTGQTADRTAAALAALAMPAPAGGAVATGWWRLAGEAILPAPTLPTGAAFARLFETAAG